MQNREMKRISNKKSNSIFGRRVNDNHLDLSYCSLRVVDIQKQLLPFLKEHSEIDSLDLSYNDLGDGVIPLLSKACNIKTVNLAYNGITNVGALLLSENKKIVSLDLSLNTLTSKACTAFVNHPNLKILNLYGNFIGDNGLKILAKSECIVKLDVGLTGITAKGAAACFKNNYFVELDLEHNYLDADLVSQLIKHCSKNRKLLDNKSRAYIRKALDSVNVSRSDLTDMVFRYFDYESYLFSDHTQMKIIYSSEFFKRKLTPSEAISSLFSGCKMEEEKDFVMITLKTPLTLEQRDNLRAYVAPIYNSSRVHFFDDGLRVKMFHISCQEVLEMLHLSSSSKSMSMSTS